MRRLSRALVMASALAAGLALFASTRSALGLTPKQARAAVPDQSVGVVTVWDDERVGVMARGLGGHLGESADRMAERLRSARVLPGPNLYLQLQHRAGPFEVEVVPSDRPTVFFPAGKPPMVGHIPQGVDPGRAVVMLWVLNGADRKYTVLVPKAFRHVTIVANGREITKNEQLKAHGSRRSYQVR